MHIQGHKHFASILISIKLNVNIPIGREIPLEGSLLYVVVP